MLLESQKHTRIVKDSHLFAMFLANVSDTTLAAYGALAPDHQRSTIICLHASLLLAIAAITHSPITLPATPAQFYHCLLRRCIVRFLPTQQHIPSLNGRGNSQ